MPLITSVEKQARRARVNVFLDGEFAFSLRLDVVAMAGLRAGVELDSERRRALEAEDQRLGATEAALRLLSTQPRSERDLRERLEKRRGFAPEAVDQAMTRMKELGYLDDAAFARLYVDARQASPRSQRALAFELGRKGLDRAHIEAALEEHSDAEAAYDAAQRRMKALQSLDRPAFERRLSNFLAGRGFSYGITRSTVERCWRELQGEADDF